MQGLSDEIITALDCLTRRKGESYEDFIRRVLPNELACHVKLADLVDHMDLTRIQNPGAEDEARIQKYKLAADRILDALPDADPIPNCRLIEVNGVAEIHPAISSDQFCDRFIRFMEAQGWFFSGGFKDITDDKQEDCHARE